MEVGCSFELEAVCSIQVDQKERNVWEIKLSNKNVLSQNVKVCRNSIHYDLVHLSVWACGEKGGRGGIMGSSLRYRHLPLRKLKDKYAVSCTSLHENRVMPVNLLISIHILD